MIMKGIFTYDRWGMLQRFVVKLVDGWLAWWTLFFFVLGKNFWLFSFWALKKSPYDLKDRPPSPTPTIQRFHGFDGFDPQNPQLSWQLGSLQKQSPENIEFLCLKAFFQGDTLLGTNISHLRKRKIIFKSVLVGDMLVPGRISISPIRRLYLY